MRAMYNPTRMIVIEDGTKKLIEKIKSCCPVCNTPGYSIDKIVQGLKCEYCHNPTRSTLSHVYVCKKCSFNEEKMYPHQKLFEEQAKHLEVDLIIFDLSTNDLARGIFNKKAIENKLNQSIHRIRTTAPVISHEAPPQAPAAVSRSAIVRSSAEDDDLLAEDEDENDYDGAANEYEDESFEPVDGSIAVSSENTNSKNAWGGGNGGSKGVKVRKIADAPSNKNSNDEALNQKKALTSEVLITKTENQAIQSLINIIKKQFAMHHVQ
jgi:hypothetical protein